MFKMELQTEAQKLCDKSFTVVSEIFYNTQRTKSTLLHMLTPDIYLVLCRASCAVGLCQTNLPCSALCVHSQIWAASTRLGHQ